MRLTTLSRFAWLLCLFILTFCKAATPDGCVDESKISEGPCTFEYAPVCGCDGKTYSNACVATRHGLTSWVEGECK